MSKYHPFNPKKQGRGFSSFCKDCGYSERSHVHVLKTVDEMNAAKAGQKPSLLPLLNKPLQEPEQLTAFEGGATRSNKAERRELIPKTAIDALARRLALGAAKHGVNNWRKGGAEFRLATINHLLDHVFEYLENGGAENTDAIICNAAFLCEYEARSAFPGIAKTAVQDGN